MELGNSGKSLFSAVRKFVIFGLIVLCVIGIVTASVDVENKLDVDTNGIAKRQAEDVAVSPVVPTDTPVVGEVSSQVPQSTKKPKKKKKNKDKKNKKNKKNKTTPAPTNPLTNATAFKMSSSAAITTTSPDTDALVEQNVAEEGNFTLEFDPKKPSVHESKILNITVTYSNLKSMLILKLKNVDPYVYKLVSNDTIRLMPLPAGKNATKIITIQGKNLGITGLAIIVIDPNKPPPKQPTHVQIIRVTRIPRSIDKIFDYSLLPLVIIATTGMGCKMEWTLIKTQLKRPFPIAVGPLCQFVLMPFFSFAIAKMVDLDPLTAFGLLTVGSCPGGGLSNMITLLLQADLIQSVVMTFVSTILAVGMLPFNLWVYARAFAPENGGGGDDDQRMGLPLGKILSQIIMLTVPLLIGITIRHKLPKVAYYLLKPLNALSAFLVTSSLGIGIYSNAYVIKSPWEILLSAFLLPVFGFTAGFLIAKFIARLKTRSAMTVCIETGVQNNLVAISMLKLSFPQPEADLMARTPIFVAITAVSIGIGMIVVGIPINRRAARKKAAKEPAEPKSVDDKVDNVAPPESPDYGYDYKPLPYEKAIAMNGNSVNNNDTTLYKQLQNEIDELKKGENTSENEVPLYEKMRKSSKETDV